MELHDLIRTRREARGISQTEAANRAGVSHTTFNRAEQGITIPQQETIDKIGDVLGFEYKREPVDYQVWIPTGYRQITLEDVQRWQAMEARLEEAIEHAHATDAYTVGEEKERQQVLEMLEYIRDGQ